MKQFINRCCYVLLFYSFCAGCTMSAQAQVKKPFRYWTFDQAKLFSDQINDFVLDKGRYKVGVDTIAGAVGEGIQLLDVKGILLTASLRNNITTAATIELCFKGDNLKFQSFATPNYLIKLFYPYLEFTTTILKNGKKVTDTWRIFLKKSGRESYDYYTDGNWHYLVFVIDTQKGFKQIFVDGVSPESFLKKIDSNGDALVFDGGDGFRCTAMLDELAFYNYALPASVIASHYNDVQNKKHYSFDTPVANTAKTVVAATSQPHFDTLEFAPGYPDYTVQATDQLKAFPDPRYKPGQDMMRNFPWLDISYLHRELPGNGGKGFGKANPAKAVDLSQEMASRWNYYVELPCLRVDSGTARKKYADPASLEGALIRYAQTHPEYPTATVTMQIQNRPVHAGFDHARTYENAQDLPDRYYLRDTKGNVIQSGGKKWLSPLAPLDIIQKDGSTTAFYLRQVVKYLGRPIDMINDNGELFNHMRSASLLESDPAVKADIAKRRLTIPQYNGWFQNRLDTSYKNTILRTMGWKRTLFTFYNVSAYNAEYWPDYSMRRTTNFVKDGIHYSTPAFYPSRPDNWRSANGPLNGYGAVAQGRLREIAIGDKLFAPFVSGGWSFEELNIRPAQWLSLLKSMVMLGAEFFHVGYFNVTGRTGWPNGAGPNDPRGYIYQVAMPSYAQAMASHVQEFLLHGKLLNPRNSSDKVYPFRFEGTKENQLILVRQLGHKYLIYGSIQPNSNYAGNVDIEEDTRIVLGDNTIRFSVRKQGSMYILDSSGKAPVFYQLDGWHQYEHPYFWNRKMEVEAENADSTIKSPVLVTTKEGNAGDYRQFCTYYYMQQGQGLIFDLPVKHGTSGYGCSIRIRSADSKEIVLDIIKGEYTITKTITGSNWQVLNLSQVELQKLFSSDSGGRLFMVVRKGQVDIDKVTF